MSCLSHVCASLILELTSYEYKFISLLGNWHAPRSCVITISLFKNGHNTKSLFFISSVHLVELQGSGELFAMKAMDKSVMLNRNKVIS